MKIYFSIPDFYYHFDINSALLSLMNEHPEMINSDVVIDSIYGSFPNAIWNGGRVCIGVNDAKNAEDTIRYFNDRCIPVRYTFTNHLLNEKQIWDTWCNTLMRKADNGKNEVTVNSDVLNHYLRETYPRFRRISSTTKGIKTIDDFNAECEKDFHLCVLGYGVNNNFELLQKIKHPEKTEIMVNEPCVENCPYRQEHYASVARWQINNEPDGFRTCGYYDFAAAMSRKHFISYRDIVEVYAPMGFNHFKIVGRTSPKHDVVEAYVHYFIRPVYQTQARLFLLSQVNGSRGFNSHR